VAKWQSGKVAKWLRILAPVSLRSLRALRDLRVHILIECGT